MSLESESVTSLIIIASVDYIPAALVDQMGTSEPSDAHIKQAGIGLWVQNHSRWLKALLTEQCRCLKLAQLRKETISLWTAQQYLWIEQSCFEIVPDYSWIKRNPIPERRLTRFDIAVLNRTRSASSWAERSSEWTPAWDRLCWDFYDAWTDAWYVRIPSKSRDTSR